MSVDKIKAFSIIGKTSELDNVITVLGKSGVFHPDDVKSFYPDTRGFARIPSGNPYSEPLSRIVNAMSALDIAPEYIKISGRFNPSFEEIDSYSKMLADKVGGFADKQNEYQRKFNECKRTLEETSHFLELDSRIDELLGMEYVKAVFGRMPRESAAKLKSGKYKLDCIEFIPCSNEGEYVWGVYFVPVSEKDKAQRIFSRLYFEESSFGRIDGDPANTYKLIKAEYHKYESLLMQINNKIRTYTEENTRKILKYYTKASEYNLFYSIKAQAMERDGSFILTGWVPEDDSDALEQKLEAIHGVEISVSSGKDELVHSPPVRLKNIFLARPFQFFTEMYGVPKYRELDPTAFIAFTYVLLFGIMFGDVGHGLIVMIAGALMWFIRKMPIGKILIPCGFSGMIFGAIYGDVFGFEHAMDWLYKGVFGLREKPIEVMSPKFTGTILFTAIGLGMALLCVAMLLNIYTSLRQKNLGKALFDTSGVAGLLFYAMICAGFMGLMIFNVNLFSPLYVWTIVAMFIIVFFREPLTKLVNLEKGEKIKWGSFIMENIFESIEVILSYVTNTMSFLRVAAFVLVHAGMMQVVFTLAETAGSGGYWPVVILGNGLVAALECLLVCIQVLRLEYYEMFSRFYTGEGRPYEPVRLRK